MMTGFRLNFTPLKEPLGFVKLVEWVSAVGSSCSAKPGGRERASIPGFFPFFFSLTFKKRERFPKVSAVGESGQNDVHEAQMTDLIVRMTFFKCVKFYFTL